MARSKAAASAAPDVCPYLILSIPLYFPTLSNMLFLGHIQQIITVCLISWVVDTELPALRIIMASVQNGTRGNGVYGSSGLTD
jgi:hypothetical protein